MINNDIAIELLREMIAEDDLTAAQISRIREAIRLLGSSEKNKKRTVNRLHAQECYPQINYTISGG